MAFDRSTLTALVARTETDLLGRLTGGLSAVRRSIERAIARVQAGGFHSLYGRLDYVAKQLMVDTADGEHLRRWAGVFNVQPKDAVAASGTVTLTGVDGSDIETGARLQREDGLEYVVTADATIAAGSAAVLIEAAIAGAAGNAEAGTVLTLVSPIAGVASAGAVAGGGLVGGVEAEADDALLGRLLDRLRNPPKGGAASDYVLWAKEVPGVTRAWPFPERGGLGTVGVAIVFDDRVDIIPAGGDLTAVADYIEPRRPVTADVTVFALTPLPLDPHITLTPNTAEAKAAVLASLADLTRREGKPGGTLLISHIREAISVAQGETDHVLTSPSANVVAGAEEIVIVGTPVWA